MCWCQAKDQEGRTPLHYAAALHDSGIFYRYLLKCGADELIQDKYGKTAKHYVYAPQDIDLNSLVRRCQEMPRLVTFLSSSCSSSGFVSLQEKRADREETIQSASGLSQSHGELLLLQPT